MPDQFGNLTPEELAAQEAKKAISSGATKSKPATGSKKTIAQRDLKSAQSIGGSQSSGENSILNRTKGTDFEKRELPGKGTADVKNLSGGRESSEAGNEVNSEETESQIKNAGSTSGITSLEMGGDNIAADESDGVIGDLVHDANNSNPADFLNPLELGGGGDGTEAESLTSSTSAPVIGGDYDPMADVEQAQKEAEKELNRFVKEQLDANPFLALVEWDITTTVVYQTIDDYSGVPYDERNNLAQLEWEEYNDYTGVPTDYRDEVMEREIEQERLAAEEAKALAEEEAAKLALAATSTEKNEILDRFYSTGKYSPDDEAAKLLREVLYSRETRFMNVDELMVQYMLQLTGDVVIDPTAEEHVIKPLLDENGNTIAEPYEFGKTENGKIDHDVAMRDENGDIVVRDENGNYVDPESIGVTIADNEFVGDVIDNEKDERLLYLGDTNESLNTYHDCISFVDEIVYIFRGSHIGYNAKGITNAMDPANSYDHAKDIGLNLVHVKKSDMIDYGDLPVNTIVFFDFDTDEPGKTPDQDINRHTDHIGFFVGFNRDKEPLIIDASSTKRGVSVKPADDYFDYEVGYIPYPYWGETEEGE